jgi:hypothetical protein
MGYSELTEQFWWLTIVPEAGPEIIAISPRKEERGWVADRLNLAIFEYAHHAPVAGVAAAIVREREDKAYPVDDRLVCYVHHRVGETFNMGEVAAQVRAMRPRIAEVWLVGSVEADEPEDYVVARLHPAPWELRLNYRQQCAETPQIPILDTGQGSRDEVAHGFMEIELP